MKVKKYNSLKECKKDLLLIEKNYQKLIQNFNKKFYALDYVDLKFNNNSLLLKHKFDLYSNTLNNLYLYIYILNNIIQNINNYYYNEKAINRINTILNIINSKFNEIFLSTGRINKSLLPIKFYRKIKYINNKYMLKTNNEKYFKKYFYLPEKDGIRYICIFYFNNIIDINLFSYPKYFIIFSYKNNSYTLLFKTTIISIRDIEYTDNLKNIKEIENYLLDKLKNNSLIVGEKDNEN